jgi:alpha-L-fucosidase
MLRTTAKVLVSLLTISILITTAGCQGFANKQNIEEQRATALRKWNSQKFGMFVHWGIYSIPAGIWNGEQIPKLGEQIQRHASIPQAEYAVLAKQFNPVKFDADEYVRIAKNAGMKYIVITSKHHDGFNMFHTKLSEYNIVDATPYGKDIIKELADACARGGLKFGVYYSTPDWGYPHAVKRDPANAYSVFETVTPKHEEYMTGQLAELLTGYGPMFELFFDMGAPTPEQSKRFADTVRTLQPECMINGRVMNGQGDFLTMPDNHIPSEIIDIPWETPATFYLNANTNTWGYKSWVEYPDLEEKVKEQIHLMAKVVSRGGNYLLNVGPKSDGTIIDYELKALKKIGKWMRVNKEAIYNTQPSPFQKLTWGECSRKPGILYFHIFDWPADGKLVIDGLRSKVKKAYLLADRDSSLKVTQKGMDTIVTVPTSPADPYLTVVAVEIEDNKPRIIQPFVAADKEGVINLTAEEAFSRGHYSRESYKSLYSDTWRSWDFRIKAPAAFDVEISASKAKGAKELFISVGDQKLTAKVSPSKSITEKIGSIELTKAGRHTLAVRTDKNTESMRLQLSFRLIPK